MNQQSITTAPHSCDEHMEIVRRDGTYTIHGTEVPIHENLYRCTVCGEEEFSYAQIQAVEREAGRVYREQQGFP